MSFEFPGGSSSPNKPATNVPKMGKNPGLMLLLLIGAAVIFFLNSRNGQPNRNDQPNVEESRDLYSDRETDIGKNEMPTQRRMRTSPDSDWSIEDVDPTRRSETQPAGDVELLLKDKPADSSKSSSGDWSMDTDPDKKSGGNN